MGRISVFLSTLIIILLSGHLFAQSFPSEYYKVIHQDSVYVFSSDTQILIFSSAGSDGNFSLLSHIPGNYDGPANIALNYNDFLIEKNDTIYLYDISDYYNPTLLSVQHLGPAVDAVYGFGPYFVIKTGNTLKLLSIMDDSLQIIEDSLLISQHSVQFSYPYLVNYRSIYKYLENFGIFEIYQIDDDCTIGCEFIAENRLYYTTFKQPWPSEPPTICGIRSRILEEPDFPIALDNTWWGDCIPDYIADFYSGSKRYFYYMDWHIPPNGGRIVVNYSGTQLYQHTSWDYTLHLTDEYLFQLGADILYSVPASPANFNQLEFSLTGAKESKNRVTGFVLKNNYPNPFNPSTTIEYSLSERSSVSLVITDILGQQVRVLIDEEQSAGSHTVSFNADNLPSGVYYYSLRSGSYFSCKKMVLVK
jgi:hypothetical protein